MSKPLHPKARVLQRAGLFAGLKTFAELETRIAALSEEKARGDAFEVFAEAYLATQRKHDAAHVWPHGSMPLDVLKNLGLTQQDQGVDGVLQTLLGQFDAYQVKFRAGRPALTWRELSTFIGLADSPRIHSRVVLTNCDELPAVLNDRQGFFCIRGADLDRLEGEDLRAIEAWLAEAAYTAPKKTPQPHQAEGLDVLLPALQTHDRVSAIMACGTGKTLLALWIAEAVAQASQLAGPGDYPVASPDTRPESPVNPQTGMSAPLILVLVPSLALLRQTLHEWLRETKLPKLAYLCVCSDPTVKEGLDALTTTQSDLDFQVTTDAASVRRFLDAPFAGVKLVFSTYQSASVVGAAMQPGEAFDFAVFDEAHKTAGREGRNFGFALEDKNLPIRKRLFLTATPRHFDIRHRDKDGEFKVQSMDDVAVYGPRAYTLSFAAAAQKGIICRYKVIISLINKQMVSDFARRHGITLLQGDEISARWVANLIALKQAVEKVKASKIITFHSRVKMADEFAAPGPRGIAFQLDGYDVRHVNGSQRSLVRSNIMRAFADAPKSILTNASCLTEGVDIPAVDMVAFIDPKQSRVDIAQAVGRAMRKPRGVTTKAVGYVVVPLFAGMDERDSLEEAVRGEEFEVVADVLNALQEHDEELVEIIREIKERKGRGEPFDPRRLNEQVQVVGPLVELNRLSASIAVEIGDRIGVSWDEWFGVLQRYVARERHCLVPVKHCEGTYRLGSWVSEQRQQQYSMSVERRQSLEALSFEWDPMAAAWEEGFLELQQFKAREHHCRVSPTHVEGTYRLGQWVGTQRRTESTLPLERIQRLDALGFEWDPFAANWQEGFDALERFKAREHHGRVPATHLEGTYRLGSWASNQRNHRDNMPVERRQKLEALGFEWDLIASAWEEGYAALERFKARERHCRVPASRVEGNYKLGQWVSEQRKRRARLPVERTLKLGALGFEWDPTAADLEDGFAALERFRAREGHCRVPRGYLEGTYKLGTWVPNLRRKKDSMPVERRQRLEALGFEWDPFTTYWEEGFAALQKFHAREGHCRVPVLHIEGTHGLGSWVRNRRRQKDKLSVERRQRLEALGFEWELLGPAWEEGFAALQRFKAREHHCRVPTGNLEGTYGLGQWATEQRKLRDSMPLERRQRLEALGFEWNLLTSAWEEGFAALERFKAREGHCQAPRNHHEGTCGLGRWVSRQRKQRDRMPVERRQRLESLGFEWDPLASAWEEGFAALQKFHERECHCRVPRDNLEGTYRLGQWVSDQRKRKNAMPVERRQRLDALGFVWRAA